MREVFLPRADWVLSGSLEGWGDVFIPVFDLVVLLTTPREIRLQRLRAREATHFGPDAVAPGGWPAGLTGPIRDVGLTVRAACALTA